MKTLIFLLLVLIGLLQYRLWFGDGGIREYEETQKRIADLKAEGERLRERNAALDADVRDLTDGEDAVEERARQELGMVRQGETFVQVFDKPPPPPPEAAPEKPRRGAAKPASGTRKGKPRAKTGSHR